jgi:hypothetical protein
VTARRPIETSLGARCSNPLLRIYAARLDFRQTSGRYDSSWSFFTTRETTPPHNLPLLKFFVFSAVVKTNSSILAEMARFRVRSAKFQNSILIGFDPERGMAKPKKSGSSSQKKPIEQYAHEGKQRAANPPVGLVTPCHGNIGYGQEF